MATRTFQTLVEIDPEVFLPCYRPLLNNHDALIHFLWGGRDSGKSHFIAQALVMKCLTAKSFRCLLIKDTHNSVKEAQWQTIYDVVYEWGLQDLFVFHTSPLEIMCVNGNRFVARGCDDPQNLKSIRNPTDAWVEEGNQLTYDDFIVIVTTLRSNLVEPQIYFSFNPETKGRYEDFWLYKIYFKKHYEQGKYTFESVNMIEVGYGEEAEQVPIKYTSTHTTYYDNRYCTPLRRAFFEQLKNTSPYYYNVYTLGLWGNRLVENPFAYAFDRNKHTGQVAFNRAYNVILSFDFNRNPITCLVLQLIGPDRTRGLEQIKLATSNIYELCAYIRKRYSGCTFMVTGDATGKNSSALVKDQLNYYKVIAQQLGLGPRQFKVPKVNPHVEDNQLLVNTVLQNTDCVFDKDKCAALIFDLENVEMKSDGSINKRDRNNPAMQADALDCFRYYCNAFLKHVLTSGVRK